MTDAVEAVAELGDNTSGVVSRDAPIMSSPPPPPAAAAPPPAVFVMAKDELFTREQYLQSGWTDEQLVQTGKMFAVPPPPTIEMTKPAGMPSSRYVVLDDNDDIPPTGLFVGHNGVGFMLQAGVPMHVPDYVLNVLDDAVMESPVIDPRTRQIISYRPRPRYTYREVPQPVDA